MNLHREPTVGVQKFDEQGKFARLHSLPVAATQQFFTPRLLHRRERLPGQCTVSYRRLAVGMGGDLPTFRNGAIGDSAPQKRFQGASAPNIILENRGELERIGR